MLDKRFFSITLALVLAGCATAASRSTESKPTDSPKDVQSAVSSVVNSVKGEKRTVKYCPVCGRHFSVSVMKCSVDNSELKEIEE